MRVVSQFDVLFGFDSVLFGFDSQARVLQPRARFSRLGVLAATVLMFLAAYPAFAAVHTVTNLNDSGPGSLRDAIANAASGDTINFAVTGTVRLTSGELLIQNKNLTITNAAGPDTLTVLQTNVPAGARVFHVDGGTVSIFGLTIADGSVELSGGGGILNENGADLTVNNCVIRNNSAPGGGGIENGEGATLTLINSTLFSNSANPGAGGGLLNLGTATVRNSTFDHNRTYASCSLVCLGGGGIFNDGSTVNDAVIAVSNSTFYDNSAFTAELHAGEGAGFFNARFGSATITSSTFVDDCGHVEISNFGFHLNDEGVIDQAKLTETLRRVQPLAVLDNYINEFAFSFAFTGVV